MKFPDVNKEFNVKFNEVMQIGGGCSGADGFSPIAKVEETAEGANITITDKSGTTTATIKHGKDGLNGKDGLPGADGKDGIDGKTPEKGIDYFTEAEKTELVDEIVEKIPAGSVEGLVEITDGEPTKEGTVLTVNPNAEEIHLYTAEEIDAKFDALVNGNEVAY